MMRVEAIKEKRQAQFILDRQKKAKLIEREKDAREVKRDMALIRSPAAGMKRVAREMEVDENEVFVHCFMSKDIYGALEMGYSHMFLRARWPEKNYTKMHFLFCLNCSVWPENGFLV